MSRNNSDRLMGDHKPESAEAPPQAKMKDPLHFVTPTEFVELPSKGIGYAEGHPLHRKDSIEIRFMTAKDEEILSSQTLLKKGVAVERFLQNIVIDQKIKVRDLLSGDRNAILVSARVSGYGNEYDTHINCPSCGEKNECSFDLNERKIINNLTSSNEKIEILKNGNFQITMPFSKFKVEVRLLTGMDEINIAALANSKRKRKLNDSTLLDQYNRMIVSIEGHTERALIKRYVESMPTVDSRHLRNCYAEMAPTIEIKKPFECHSCGYEQELEVPFGADFFWPDR